MARPVASKQASRGSRRSSHRLPEPGSPEAPVAFGDYQLVGRLARGGMADIFLGLPTQRSAQLTAIKCIRPNLSQQSRFVDMFLREARIALLLQHSCIVRTFDAGEVDGRYYIAMDFVPGCDLSSVLRRCQERSRRIPVPLAIQVGLCVSRALHYAHELRGDSGAPLNIVNRDVSPSNVRLSYDGQVRLLDFGIAQAALRVTSEIGILKGKFPYMSPEQIRGLPLDRRTDVFSSGIVMHEALTGERLFREETEFSLMERIKRAEIRPPSRFNQRVPPELDTIVMRALERDPDKRFATSEAVADALAPLLADYQYRESELADFVCGLFAEEYADDQALLERLCAEPQTLPQLGSQSPIRRKRRRRRPRQQRGQTVPARTLRVWIAALVLFLAAGALMLVSLR